MNRLLVFITISAGIVLLWSNGVESAKDTPGWLSLVGPLQTITTGLSIFKSDHYGNNDKADQIYHLVKYKGCDEELAELVKQVKPEDLDKCPGADKAISLTIEINDYIFEIREEGQKCYKEKQSFTDCYEKYIGPLKTKGGALADQLIETFKSADGKCFGQIYEQFDDVAKKLENECK